jgi:Double zinc ribbon
MAETTMRECPYCREDINAEATKCRHCGSPVAPEHPPHKGVCPQCKESIRPDAVVCKHCRSWIGGPTNRSPDSVSNRMVDLSGSGTAPQSQQFIWVCTKNNCHWVRINGRWEYGRDIVCEKHIIIQTPTGTIDVVTDSRVDWEFCTPEGPPPGVIWIPPWTYLPSGIPEAPITPSGSP